MRLRYFPTLVLLTLAACGGRPASHRLTIAVIPMGTTHEYWKSIHAGAVKAARELGVDVVWKGPQKEDDRAQQIEIVEDMISRRVDGIVLAPLDGKGLQTPISEARRAGIASVVVDSGLEGDDYISFIATDNHKGGRLGARRLAELLGGKGSVILMRVMVGAESTMNREQGFLDEIHNYPGIHILSDNQYGGITTETAYQTGENLLNRFPNVDGIFCPNESTTFGMLRALTDDGKAGKVKFVGFDSSEKLIAALREKQIQGLVLQNPFRMGELGVETLVRHLRNPRAPIEKHFDTGATVATPENMDTPEIQLLLSPPIDKYLSQVNPPGFEGAAPRPESSETAALRFLPSPPGATHSIPPKPGVAGAGPPGSGGTPAIRLQRLPLPSTQSQVEEPGLPGAPADARA